MDDIFGEVMLAEGDEDLGALDIVAAVGIGRCCRAECPHVGACTGFGQVHCPRPFAGHELGQIHLALFIAAMRENGLHRARCQDRAKREAHIGRAQIFEHDKGKRVRQALPAKASGAVDRSPAAFDIGLIGSFEPRWHRHPAIGPFGIARITYPVERGPFARRDRARAFENRINHVGRCLRERRMFGKFSDARHGVENEALFGNWRCVGHISFYRWLA